MLALMAGYYGSKFSDAYSGVPQPLLRRAWAKALVGYTEAEILRGTNALLSSKWVPTLPEFLLMCRPALNYEQAYYEAIDQLAAREAGTDQWSTPAIYWAAIQMATDIRLQPYKALATRWAWILDRAVADVASGRLGGVPVRPLAVTYNPNTRGNMPPEIKAQLAAMLSKTVVKGN